MAACYHKVFYHCFRYDLPIKTQQAFLVPIYQFLLSCLLSFSRLNLIYEVGSHLFNTLTSFLVGKICILYVRNSILIHLDCCDQSLTLKV